MNLELSELACTPVQSSLKIQASRADFSFENSTEFKNYALLKTRPKSRLNEHYCIVGVGCILGHFAINHEFSPFYEVLNETPILN